MMDLFGDSIWITFYGAPYSSLPKYAQNLPVCTIHEYFCVDSKLHSKILIVFYMELGIVERNRHFTIDNWDININKKSEGKRHEYKLQK